MPGMVALDLSAGGGYTTELLARAVGPTGQVYGQSRPRTRHPAPTPAAPRGQRQSLRHAAAPPRRPRRPQRRDPRRWRSPTATASSRPPSAGRAIVAVVQTFEDPVPAELADGKSISSR